MHFYGKLVRSHNYCYIKNLSQINNFSTCVDSKNVIETTSKNDSVLGAIKAFEDIPGPKPLPAIGTLWQYWPIVGTYRWDALHHAGYLKYKKFGNLVREPIAPGTNLLWVFDPDDIAVVLKDAGPGNYPERRSHLALQKYRNDRPDVYSSGGLLPTNGPEWWRLRCEFQKGLSAPQNVKNFLPSADKITAEFCDRVETLMLHKNYDFLPELSRLNLELVCLLAFDVRMNSFSNQELKSSSRSSRLIESAEITNNCILGTDNMPLWKYFPTPKYNKLRKAQNYMERVAIQLVSQKVSFYSDSLESQTSASSRSLLETYLSNPKLDLKDIVGMAADLLLAGVDTTTYTSSFLLYNVAKNPRVQNKLYNESLKLLNTNDSPLTKEAMHNASYTKAVLKESMRLNPVSVGVGRTLTKDLVLSGYLVPSGTVAVTQNQIACKLPENFPRPLEFIPERWLKQYQMRNTSSDSRIVKRVNITSGIDVDSTTDELEIDDGFNDIFPVPHPYLLLPFGHGVRACIARRFAEQNMQILLLRLVRNFEISWTGDNMDVQTLLINKPDKPVNLTFTPRFN